jgi:hypothetical protein
VYGNEPSSVRVPACLCLAAPYEASPLYIEKIGVVTFNADVKVELYGLRSVVGQVVIVVNASADGPVQA